MSEGRMPKSGKGKVSSQLSPGRANVANPAMGQLVASEPRGQTGDRERGERERERERERTSLL